jgi:hypothetical protein
MMLLRLPFFVSRTNHEAIFKPVGCHPPTKDPDAMKILFRITTLLEHLQPDSSEPLRGHALESGEILERNGEVPPPLGVFRGKSTTDKDWHNGNCHVSGKDE